MHIAEAARRLTAPDKPLSGINLQGIAAEPPSGQLHADVADARFAGKTIGNPRRLQPSVVLPFREFVVIEAMGGMLRVVASLGRNNPYALLFFLIGRRERCRPAV